MDLKLLKMRCKDCKQHHVMFDELYSVSSLLCIAQNVRFEIPYKVFYFKTPFLMLFRYYSWASYGGTCDCLCKFSKEDLFYLKPNCTNPCQEITEMVVAFCNFAVFLL